MLWRNCVVPNKCLNLCIIGTEWSMSGWNSCISIRSNAFANYGIVCCINISIHVLLDTCWLSVLFINLICCTDRAYYMHREEICFTATCYLLYAY